MLTLSLGLLLLLVPTESYLKTNRKSRSGDQVDSRFLKSQVDRNQPCSITALYDGEDPIVESISPLSQNFPVTNRNDNIKANNLLTKDWELPNAIEDIRCYLSVNESFVPVIGVHKRATFIKLRSYLFAQGVYPGVEYKILKIDMLSDSSNTKQEVQTLQGLLQRGRSDVVSKGESNWISRLFAGQTQLIQTSGGDSSIIIDSSENAAASLSSYREEEDFIELTVRPAYPLIKELEKKWPVKVRLSAVPYVFSRAMYTTVTLLGTLSFALSYFLGALLLTQVFTLSFVNSRSMTPTILPGDLILVEKISPIIRRDVFHILPASEGDVVFFSAPPRLLEYIQESNTPVKETRKGGDKMSVSNPKDNIKESREKQGTKGFSEEFLVAQQSLSNPAPITGIDSISPSAPVPTSKMDEIKNTNEKSSGSTIIDKNPFHYRNLRPIGGNTLLVKRLASISYPDVDTSTKGKNDILTPKITTDDAVAKVNRKDDRLLKVRGSKEEKKGPVCLFVRGDNPDVSLDSRQWGCLDEELVIGRPIFTVLPLKRFGFVK